jgi:hypothetical protein
VPNLVASWCNAADKQQPAETDMLEKLKLIRVKTKKKRAAQAKYISNNGESGANHRD